MMTLTCKQCGKSFQGRPRVGQRCYCSHKCYWESMRKEKISCVCAYCTNTFERWPSSQVSKSGRYYCSRTCYYAGRQLYDVPNMRKRVEVKCSTCGKILLRHPCRTGQSRNYFCSPACQSKWKREHQCGPDNPNWSPHVEVKCASCGKTLLLSQWKARRSKHKFCSPECQSEGMSKLFSGENHSNWQGGRSLKGYSLGFTPRLKKQIRKRDNHRCQICGMTQEAHIKTFNRRLPVHHIDKRKDNHEPFNLVSLCFPCHVKVHRNPAYQEYFCNAPTGSWVQLPLL